jgi:hypothetical protein
MRITLFFALFVSAGVSQAATITFGEGSAIDQNYAHQAAFFEWEYGVEQNIPLYNYQEDGLTISRIDGYTHGNSNGHMDDSVSANHEGFQGFSGGFFYGGSALEAVSISTASGDIMFALEVMIGTGYPDDDTGGSWETYRDGVLTASGTFSKPVGTTIGFFDENGFDMLLIGTGRGDQSGSFFDTDRYGATAIDNVRVSMAITPIPAAVWLFGSALAGLGWMRRKQTT